MLLFRRLDGKTTLKELGRCYCYKVAAFGSDDLVPGLGFTNDLIMV